MGVRNSRTLIAAAVAGGLWLASGLLHVVAASNVYAGRALALLVPRPTDAVFWSWPQPWAALALTLGAMSVAAVTLFVLTSIRRAAADSVAAAWFAPVFAGALVGLFVDGIGVVGSVQAVGWRGLLVTTVDFAVVGAYWGLVLGWAPALIAARGSRDDPAPRALPRRRGATAGAAAFCLVAFAVTGIAGAEANRLAIIAQTAVPESTYDGLGSAPDPSAVGESPPAAASPAEPRDPSWCTPEQAMVLLGSDDAATGHRGLSIRLLNVSAEPCTVNGYPDVAFADQNGHALDVTVRRGSSFMATDAGAEPFELPPGGYAITVVGWDANATAGALVASTLHAAQVAGDTRGSWPVMLDIVAGSTVEITAWELDELGPAVE